MQIEKRPVLGGGGTADNRVMQCRKLFANRHKSGVQPGYFIANLILWHDMMCHFQRSMGSKIGMTYGNAAGNTHSVQCKAHSLSPKQSSIRFVSACIASASSAPIVSMPRMTPLLAASIITPMMLFAFTLRSFRDNHTSL